MVCARRRCAFKNTIIIMTSNIGSQYILDVAGDSAQIQERVMAAMRSHFRPEFLNRVDEIVIFHGLTKDHLAGIVEIQLERLRNLLAAREITLSLTPTARALLVDEGYDPAYGARPLKRVIQHRIADPLALEILEGRVRDGDHVQMDASGGAFTFTALLD